VAHLQLKLIVGGMISALAIALTGCVHSQLVISHAQKALIAKQNSYLSKYAPAIEAAMQKDGTRSALVIAHENAGQPPDILPTDNPVQTLATKVNANALRNADGCVLFFRSDLPVSPQPLGCELLGNLTQGYITDANREKQQDASMEEMQRQLVTIAANLTTLAEQNKSLETTLRAELAGLSDTVGKQNEDARSMRGVIGSTTKVVSLQQAEMKELRESLKLVLASYKQSIEVVGKNNEQIDKIAGDLTNSMNAVTAQIQALKQKLDTIK
jgi:hypothetical protein